MRPYGIPRGNYDYPDVGDGRLYGVKASKVNLPGPGGDIRSNLESPVKHCRRRIWKKAERQRTRILIKSMICLAQDETDVEAK
jgi:hypothetical protein